jgi:hypothetical protein
MKIFLISEDLRNNLLAYLFERPFKEVAQGIANLQGLQEAPQPPPSEPPALAAVSGGKKDK